MTDNPVHRDDVTALRKEGDLKAYMQQLRAEGRARADLTPTPKSRRRRVPLKPPGHKPGQWPPGTSPPGPPPDWDHPPEAWADAVRRYRTEQHRKLNEETP